MSLTYILVLLASMYRSCSSMIVMTNREEERDSEITKARPFHACRSPLTQRKAKERRATAKQFNINGGHIWGCWPFCSTTKAKWKILDKATDWLRDKVGQLCSKWQLRFFWKKYEALRSAVGAGKQRRALTLGIKDRTHLKTHCVPSSVTYFYCLGETVVQTMAALNFQP